MRHAPLVVLVIGLAAAALLSRPPQRPLRGREGPLLPRAEVLHALGAAVQPLVADYYWVQTLQQIAQAEDAQGYRDIYPYADLATSLDRRWAIAYTFPAVIIPFELAPDRWLNTEESTALVRKGLQTLPDNFKLRFQLAHNLIFFERRFREGADILSALAKEPGAPPYLSALATRLYAQAGDFDVGLAMATAMRDGATDAETRAFYEHRVLGIHQERVLRRIDQAIQAFQAREGRPPRDLSELLAARDLPGAPVDPLGGTFFIARDGRARSTSTPDRLELMLDTPERRKEKLERSLPPPTPSPASP